MQTVDGCLSFGVSAEFDECATCRRERERERDVIQSNVTSNRIELEWRLADGFHWGRPVWSCRRRVNNWWACRWAVAGRSDLNTIAARGSRIDGERRESHNWTNQPTANAIGRQPMQGAVSSGGKRKFSPPIIRLKGGQRCGPPEAPPCRPVGHPAQRPGWQPINKKVRHSIGDYTAPTSCCQLTGFCLLRGMLDGA